MTEKEYRALNHVSYSSLSKLAISPQSFKANQESEQGQTPAMILGSVVDMLLTDKKRFDDEVYVMTASKPSVETMLMYCNTLAETGDSAKAYQASGYKISPNAVATKFDKEGRAYFDALLVGQGKMIIDADGMFTANQIVAQLISNLFTKRYFVPSRSPDIELKFQYPAIWDVQFKSLVNEGQMGEMRVKSLLDIVEVNHAERTVTPVDLKTGAEPFMKSYWKYKRYLQASMYTNALFYTEVMQDMYNLLPLKFIFADTNLRNAPMIFSSTDDDIRLGRYGRYYVDINMDATSEVKHKGYEQLIAELDWHIKMDKWDYSYEDYQNRGERQINAFMVKL